jgi:hypothetical protein
VIVLPVSEFAGRTTWFTVWHNRTLSGRLRFSMASLPKLPLRDFRVVQKDLEDTVIKLRQTFDPKARVKLLRNVRLLLEEADLIIESET